MAQGPLHRVAVPMGHRRGAVADRRGWAAPDAPLRGRGAEDHGGGEGLPQRGQLPVADLGDGPKRLRQDRRQVFPNRRQERRDPADVLR